MITTGKFSTTRIGFVGVGEIASSIVIGLSDRDPAPPIRLSPRGADVAQDLAARFTSVDACLSNEDVVRGSDLVVISVRPTGWKPIVEPLPWRAAQAVVSVMAGVRYAELKRHISPVRSLSRAIPLPSVASRTGLTAVWGTDPEVHALFASLGSVEHVRDEAGLNALSAATGSLSSWVRFAGTVAAWLQRRGLDEMAAARYIAAIQPDLSAVGSSTTFDTVIRELSTAGGLNEDLEARLGAEGIWTHLERSLDRLYERLSEGSEHPT